MKRKNLFSAFIVSVMTIVLAVGCSKRMPFEPEENTPDAPVVEKYLDGVINYTLSDNTARCTGEFSAYPYMVRAGGQLPLDTIKIYNGKILPMGPYDHYGLLSYDMKEWYYKDKPGTNLTVTGAEWVVNGPNSWFWLHREQVQPPVDNNRGPQGRFGMRSDGSALYLSGSIWGKATEGKYGTLIFNDAPFPMDTIYVANLLFVNGEYVLPFYLLHHRFGRFTMIFGAIVNNQWYSDGRTGCEPTLNGVWKYSADPNWFGFLWNETLPPPPPPVAVYYTIQASVNGSGGSITPSGAVSVKEGESQTFTVTPSSYFTRGELIVDGQGVGSVDSYTFSTVHANHTIVANFSPWPAQTNTTFKLTTLTPDVTVTLNGNGWAKNGQWNLNPGSYTLVVSKIGFNTYTETFALSAGQTVERTITLTAVTPPPVTNPLRADFNNATGVLTLSGDGCTNWRGAECYNPVTQPANWWAKGTVVGDRVEFTITNTPAKHNHVVFWSDAVSGYQNAGGSGIGTTYSNHRNIQAGANIDAVNTTNGYIVVEW